MACRFDLSPEGLASVLDGQPRYRWDQLWKGLHDGRDLAEITDLPQALRRQLESALPPPLALAARSVSDGGRTVKWAWSGADGVTFETVLMSYDRRRTVCVSSQAGCAMACSFCATGQAGFSRHLTTGEIVEQVVRALRPGPGQGPRTREEDGDGAPSGKSNQRPGPGQGPRTREEDGDGAPSGKTNIVFMGMGEPMANYDAVWASVQRIHSTLGISARNITISTVGIPAGIERLAGEALPVNLALSLHAANDELRDQLVPPNRRYPIARLVQACERWMAAHGRRLSLEWALIDGVNDRPADALELAALARRLGAHVNLIPLNPTPGYPTRGTPPERVRDFCRQLRASGANATVRANRGTDIAAACGQLAGTSPAAT